MERPLNPTDVGIWRIDTEIDVPAEMKLTRLIRVYRNGTWDTQRSSALMSGNTVTPWKQVVSLGYFDPDMITPKPSSDLKILGEAGDFWITVPSKTTVGRSILGEPVRRLRIGQEYTLIILAIGPTLPSRIGLSGGDVDPDRAIIRITVGARIDPLTDEERRMLRQYSNFSRSYALKK